MCLISDDFVSNARNTIDRIQISHGFVGGAGMVKAVLGTNHR